MLVQFFAVDHFCLNVHFLMIDGFEGLAPIWILTVMVANFFLDLVRPFPIHAHSTFRSAVTVGYTERLDHR